MYIAFTVSAICECLSDHAALGGIIGKDLYKEPGLGRIFIGEGLANFCNDLISGIDAELVGKTFAKKWTAIIDTLYGFFKNFDFKEAGRKLSDFVKGWFEEIDGKKIGEKELPSSYYDLKNGKVFYPADNDAGAVDSDVDDLTEPVVIPTQAQTSAQSSNDDTQSSVPETTAEATTQAETQTGNHNNAES